MSPANGHAQKDPAPASGPPPAMLPAEVLQVPEERVKQLVAALEVPFDQSQIDWRVMNTTKGQQPARGQVVPYADQRAYTDRLNALFTPAGWTRKYTIHTSANFERSADQKLAAKVLVTCELTIFGLGSHSATGEEFADDPNALTAAEAQAFKRAAVCFGLGRYLSLFHRNVGGSGRAQATKNSSTTCSMGNTRRLVTGASAELHLWAAGSIERKNRRR